MERPAAPAGQEPGWTSLAAVNLECYLAALHLPALAGPIARALGATMAFAASSAFKVGTKPEAARVPNVRGETVIMGPR